MSPLIIGVVGYGLWRLLSDEPEAEKKVRKRRKRVDDSPAVPADTGVEAPKEAAQEKKETPAAELSVSST